MKNYKLNNNNEKRKKLMNNNLLVNGTKNNKDNINEINPTNQVDKIDDFIKQKNISITNNLLKDKKMEEDEVENNSEKINLKSAISKSY